jgi:hypothetical protein
MTVLLHQPAFLVQKEEAHLKWNQLEVMFPRYGKISLGDTKY